jgi:hypothetical protein
MVRIMRLLPGGAKMALKFFDSRVAQTTAASACLLGALLITANGPQRASGAEFTTLDYPGASSMWPQAISGKNVVGAWEDHTGNIHAFVYNSSGFLGIEPQGAKSSEAVGVVADTVVGWYQAGGLAYHGFLYNSSSGYTNFDFPGATSTNVGRIADGSTIVGTYKTSDSKQHGFLKNGSAYTTLDFPGAVSTDTTEISNGRVIGDYQTSDGKSGSFLYDGHSYTTINFPGAAWTSARAISGATVVGDYANSDALSAPIYGFFFDGSKYTTLDSPWGPTVPYDVSGSNITGTYDGSGSGGFIFDGSQFAEIYPPGVGSFSAIPICISGTSVAGAYFDSTGWHGFLYDAVPEPPTGAIFASMLVAMSALLALRRLAAHADTGQVLRT